MFFTLAYWKTTGEAVLVAFATAFAGAFTFNAPTVKSLEAAAVAGAAGALYTFVKQLGAVQAAKLIPKVAVSAPKVPA